MAININPNSGQFKNPKFVKNIVRSVSTMGKEMFEDYMPETVKVYDTNKDFVKSVNNLKVKKAAMTNVKDSTLYKSGKQLVANALEDLKTGNFYNEARINQSMQDAASSMFGLDFSFMDKLGIDGVTNEVETNVENFGDNFKSTTTTNKSTIVVNSNMDALNMSFKNMSKIILKNQNIAFSALNKSFSNILAFNTENTILFYNTTTNQFAKINSVLDTFYRNINTLSNIEIGGLKESNTFNQLNSLLGSSELLSMGYYVNRLKPEGFDKSNLSPIMYGIKSALMLAMPPVIKDTLEETNTIIKNLPVMLNQKFGDMKNSDNTLLRVVGETFHKDIDEEKSKYKIKNQAIGFDGITRRAIVNVIPELISKIIVAMRKGSPDDELVYDYSSGGYRSKGDIKKASHMQFQQQIRGVAGFESDIEKYKNKVLADLEERSGSKNSKSVRRQVDKAIYNMLKEKHLPIKGSKYSSNDNINNSIIETFLKMSPLEKVDFVNAVTRLTTPQEWLEQNESYHNVFDPLGYDDIKKKYDKDHREELYLYFKSKGMNKLADRIREGEPYKRQKNNLSKSNPFYYMVEGLRAGNDIMTKILLSDSSSTQIDKNSFIGKLNTKLNDIMSKPFSENIRNLSEKFKNYMDKNPFIQEIRNSGLISGLKGLFKEAGEYITEDTLNNKNGNNKNRIIDKIKKEFFNPIVGMFKHLVTDPLKKHAGELGGYVKSVFTAVTEPVKRVYLAYKEKYISVNGNIEKEENTAIERAKTEKEMRDNEKQVSKAVQTEVQKSDVSKYTELDKTVSRGIIDMVKSIRTDLVKPIDSFSTAISLVMTDGDAFVKKVGEYNLRLDIDRENYSAYSMDEMEIMSSERIGSRVLEYQRLSTEIHNLIYQIEEITGAAQMGNSFEEVSDETFFEDDENQNEEMPNGLEETTGRLGNIKERAKKLLSKIEEKYGNKEIKETVDEGFKSLGDKTTGTLTGIIDKMLKYATNSSNSLSNIYKNTVDFGKEFFSKTLPDLMKVAGDEIKTKGKLALETLKNTGANVWTELKGVGTKIWTTTKEVFGTIGEQLLDFVSKVRQQEFDVFIEGGTLTGIKNVVYYVKPKKSGYEEMKDKFKEEDADDAADTAESDEYAEENRKGILSRIKERFKFIGDIVKSVAGSAFTAVTSSIKNLASSLLSTIGSTIMTVIGPKIASVVGKVGGKVWNTIKGGTTKVKNRTKKGKANLGKIAGNVFTTANGLLTDATPVYVVGGFLEGVGGGDSDLDLDLDDIGKETAEEVGEEITEEVLDETLEKAEKEIAEEIGEEAAERAGKEIMEEMAEEGAEKGLKKLTKWFGNSKLGKWLGGTSLGSKLKSLFSKGSDGLGFFGKMKKSISKGITKGIDNVKDLGKSIAKFGDDAIDMVKGAGKGLAKYGDNALDIIKGLGKNGLDVVKSLSKIDLKSGGKLLDGIKAIGTGKLANILDAFSLVKTGKVAKAGGKLLPLIGDIASIIDIGVDLWQVFKKGNTVGTRIAKGLSAILKVGVEALDIYLLDTGLVSIVGGLLVDWLTDKLGAWIDKINPFAKKNKEGSSAEPKKEDKKDKDLDKKVATATSTAVATNASFTAEKAQNYQDFKAKEAEQEAKFVAKLNKDERDEYLSNKNASVYSSILRTQDGGKMVRLLMNTAVASSSASVGMNEDDVITLLNKSVTDTMKEASSNGSIASPSTGGGTTNGGSDSSNPVSGGGPDISGESDTAKAVWKFFTGKGFTPAATAGILGNMYQESGVNPSSIQGGGKGPAAGICQWENYNKKSARWKNMSDYAASKGKSWTDLQSQLEWLDMELQGKDSTTLSLLKKKVGGYENFKKMTNVNEATRVFEESFERAGKPNMERRYSAAQKYFQQFATTNASRDLRQQNEEGSFAEPMAAVNNKDKFSASDNAISAILNENSTGRLSTSMNNSVSNLDTISESINVINNSTLDIGVTISSPLDTAIDLLNNINKNVEDSINKETVVEKQESTKLNNKMNPFVDYMDDNIDLSLRSFSLDIKAIIEGI